jgi:methionyl-tRNA formyltransferase
MAEPLRLLFMGSDAVALPLLNWLEGEGSRIARIAGVVTGPDRPSGRGQEVRPNPVKAWTSGRAFPVLQPEKLDPAALEAVSALRADVALVVAYGQILRDDFIAVPRLGTLNLHASILPAYRGASPIQTAVACGDVQTGMTLMRIVRELDAGPVADVERVDIARLDTALDVEAKLSGCAVALLRRALPRLARGELSFVPQDASLATFCRRLGKPDGVLDFAASASVLSARVNGLFSWPSVAVDILGTSVRVGLSDAVDGGAPAPPGTVTGSDALGLLVATGSGTLRLRRLQRPGGRMIDASEFLRGFPVPAGTALASRPMPALVAAKPFRG